MFSSGKCKSSFQCLSVPVYIAVTGLVFLFPLQYNKSINKINPSINWPWWTGSSCWSVELVPWDVVRVVSWYRAVTVCSDLMCSAELKSVLHSDPAALLPRLDCDVLYDGTVLAWLDAEFFDEVWLCNVLLGVRQFVEVTLPPGGGMLYWPDRKPLPVYWLGVCLAAYWLAVAVCWPADSALQWSRLADLFQLVFLWPACW